MATQRSSKGTSSSSHGKGASGKSKSSSSEKNRNGAQGGSSKQSASARHGRESQERSRKPRSRSEERGSESSPQEQEQGGSMSRAAGGVKGAGSKVAETVKQYPIAASAIGVGIAAGLTYMAVRVIKGSSASQDQRQDEGEEDQGYDDEGAEDQGEAEMSSQTEGEEDEGGEEDEEGSDDDEEDPGFMGRTRKAFGSVGGRMGGAMRNGASSVGQSVGHGYQAGKEKLGNVWQNPVAVGAGILAAGMAAGMLLPSTTQEKRLFGGSSGKLSGRLRSAGQELLEQGKEIASKVVSEAGDTLREEAEREGLTPDRLSRKVRRIASKLKDSVVDAATE